MSKNKNVYINSLQASDIYENMLGKPIKNNYVGMIPYSLNLIKLKEFGLKTYEDKRGKERTDDVINLKFETKVKHIDDILEKFSIEKLKERLQELTQKSNTLKTKTETKKNDFAIAEMTKFIDYLERRKNNQSDSEIPIKKLREILYKNGFTYKGEEYVVYKRTSAKSRTGQCQFIKKSLRDKSIRWARLGMNLDGFGLKDGVDPASLFAYESLVDSSIIYTIKIKPENIFVVEDVISVFSTSANIVKNDECGDLVSIYSENHTMESDIFDGESILDESYFGNGKGCMLLRNHMFKSCAFNGKLQKFLKDNIPNGVDFDDWELIDMFGRIVKAKDIYLLTTPNSLKFLKFYKRKKTKKLMYEHWEKKVKDDNCRFGICKYEKASKRGTDENGNILNQMSYQILNSKPYSLEEIKKLSQFEIDYINNLKNSDDHYMYHLINSANDMNANQMLCEIYANNRKVVNTEMFKNKRKADINSYVMRISSGKIRTNSDYCVICQNPKEMMYHMIGKLPVDGNNVIDQEKWENENSELIYNQFHTTLHQFGREYSVFRNPHTSPSNVLILKNIESSFISTYMNATDNIAYTNAIGIEINRILSGQDVDSDTILVVNDDEMLKVSKRCYGHYRVCDNQVESEKIPYKVSSEDMAKIDNSLSKSQRYIGEVVNLGQHGASMYWEEYKKDPYSERTDDLLKVVDICTILSEIAIDMAKKMYDVNFPTQIRKIKSRIDCKEKPIFFKFVSKNNNMKTKKYETTMDYLGEVMDEIESADTKETLPIMKVIGKKDYKLMKKHKKQVEKFNSIINEYIEKKRNAYSAYRMSMRIRGDEETAKGELYRKLDDLIHDCEINMSKYKITEETIYYAIEMIERQHINTREILTYLNILYNLNREAFLNVFSS